MRRVIYCRRKQQSGEWRDWPRNFDAERRVILARLFKAGFRCKTLIAVASATMGQGSRQNRLAYYLRAGAGPLPDHEVPSVFIFFQPASFRSLPVADFSRHSREQYSDSFEPGPIARSAGIHVPQATQRTSLFSVLTEPLRCGVAFALGDSRVPRSRPRTFFTIAM